MSRSNLGARGSVSWGGSKRRDQKSKPIFQRTSANVFTTICSPDTYRPRKLLQQPSAPGTGFVVCFSFACISVAQCPVLTAQRASEQLD